MSNRASGFWADVDTKAYTHAMRMLDREALPRTVAAALNSPAEAIARESKRNVERRLIVRTKFTTNSIRQDRTARGQNFRTMHSRVGTLSPYLPIQDEGGEVKAQRQRIPIPTLDARTGRNARRAIASRYRMDRMGAFSKGSRFFMGRSRSGRQGIYERMANRVRMVRNLEHSSVRVPASRWWSDAVARYGTAQFIRAQFIRAAEAELAKVRRQR